MKKLLLGLSSLFISSSGAISVVSCYNQQPTSIVFQAAQGQAFPLATALKPFVKYYNETFKDTEDFMKVKLQFQDDYVVDGEKIQGHKSFSEFGLIKDAKSNIESGDFKKVPNIILGAQSGAYVINQEGRLLDLSDKGITKNLFFDKIANLHSVLAGQGQTDKIFNIPFDNADVDSAVFNLRLLNKMFEIIQRGGGTVTGESEVIKKALAIETKEIPTTSIWAYVDLKTTQENPKPFEGYTVDDETFKTLDGIRELAKKFSENIEIKNEEKITTSTLSGEVLSIDYQDQAFLKELHTKIEDEKKAAFQLDENKKVKYNLIEDDDVKSKFKSLWESYSDTYKTVFRKEIKEKGAVSTKAFHSIKYMKNGKEEWGSWEILKFQSAVSFAASVGAYQNKITRFSKNHPYLGKVEKGQEASFYKNNASEKDVLMTTQVIKSKGSKYSIFNEGGSSIIPVASKHDKVNKATKKFLEWLYKGNNKIGLTEENNWFTLAKTSGYVMPLKDVVSKDQQTKFKQMISDLEAKIKDKTNQQLTDDDATAKLHFELNMLRSASISLDSLLKLNDENTIAKAMVTDDKSAQMVAEINSGLFVQARDEKHQSKTFDQLLQTLNTIKQQ
ncbi:glycerol ABC transporter substrate-binding protein [Mycoplasma cottewii]|uniref:Glycerol ABC transporter substrate-binding protein n=1 Tax=Mycoplasma cottewii TaxID=51364 RepID=A0ABY5TZP6_9MOLU|nr:glycerol ABC transporter substrate-binding protein [Mycoplasma cottewii]UWD34703.1 glycerol ABC transporter substrate-binding protein [Mycoplasma cottewii]